MITSDFLIQKGDRDGLVEIVDSAINKTADDFMNESSPGAKLGRPSTSLLEAKAWLADLLVAERKTATEVYEAAKEVVDTEGKPKFSESTLERAKTELGIESRQEWCKETNKNQWVWTLPSTPDTQNSMPPNPGRQN